MAVNQDVLFAVADREHRMRITKISVQIFANTEKYKWVAEIGAELTGRGVDDPMY